MEPTRKITRSQLAIACLSWLREWIAADQPQCAGDLMAKQLLTYIAQQEQVVADTRPNQGS